MTCLAISSQSHFIHTSLSIFRGLVVEITLAGILIKNRLLIPNSVTICTNSHNYQKYARVVAEMISNISTCSMNSSYLSIILKSHFKMIKIRVFGQFCSLRVENVQY